MRFVAALLDQLGIGRCVLAGNSFGGQVAWATALAHPGRVERLILVAASGYPWRSGTLPLGFRIARAPVLNRLTRYFLPRGVVESSLRSVYGDPDKVTAELIDRHYELTLRAGNRAALAERFRQVEGGSMADQIGNLRLPTLILWGGRDRLLPAEDGQRFQRDVAGSQLVLFDDLGHVPHEEDPSRTLAAMLAFLGQP